MTARKWARLCARGQPKWLHQTETETTSKPPQKRS